MNFARFCICGIAVFSTFPALSADAKASDVEVRTVVHELEMGTPASLIDLWLSLSSARQYDWQFSFISTNKSSALRRRQRASLISELELARQSTTGTDSSIINWTKDWSDNLSTVDHFRVPGRWDIAHMIAFPNQMPPIIAVSAAGYCDSVRWVELWDTQGVHRIQWRRGMRLSDLLASGELNAVSRTSWVQMVMPWGEQKKVGIAPWNIQDQPVIPGTRIVAPFKQDGYSAYWLNRSLPDFLAHAVTGDQCWRAELQQMAVPEQ